MDRAVGAGFAGNDIARMVETARQVVQTAQQRLYDFSIIDTATNENQEYVFLITPVMGRNVIVGYVLLGRPADPGGSCRACW